MKNERKIKKRIIYEGFGFPIVFENVSMVRVRGDWTPDIDYNNIAKHVLNCLSQKPARLTGDEIRFIRHSFEMTLVEFAKRFSVTHPAVLKWEKSGCQTPSMNWPIEKDIRLAIVAYLRKTKTKFFEVYEKLKSEPKEKVKPICLDLSKAA